MADPTDGNTPAPNPGQPAAGIGQGVQADGQPSVPGIPDFDVGADATTEPKIETLKDTPVDVSELPIQMVDDNEDATSQSQPGEPPKLDLSPPPSQNQDSTKISGASTPLATDSMPPVSPPDMQTGSPPEPAPEPPKTAFSINSDPIPETSTGLDETPAANPFPSESSPAKQSPDTADGSPPPPMPPIDLPSPQPPLAGAMSAETPPVSQPVPGPVGVSTPPPPMPPVIPPPPPGGIGGPVAPAGAKPASAMGSTTKKNWMPTIMIMVLLLILVAGGFWAARWFLNRDTGPGGPVTITYWGIWEPEEVMRGVFDQFEQSNPNVKIEYVLNSPTEYRQRLQSALASEGTEGPDIFRFHNTWVPMFKDYLAPIPDSVYTPAQFEETFYLVAQQDLKRGVSYVGIPLMIDGLGLFYNEDIFIADLQQPPTSWDEFQQVATKLTVMDPNNKGVMLRGGAALGTTANVDHWSDILGVMMMQAGADLAKPVGRGGQEAVTYFNLYTKTYKTWDPLLPNSTLAFATGKLAMYFGPSWEAHTINTLARENGQEIRFKILPIPQLPETNVTWASYWVEGVSTKSSPEAQAASWDLLGYLSSREAMEQLYAAQSQVRGFGEIYSRVDMADQLKDHPQAGAFVLQAPAARSWYIASNTTDRGGINEKMINYYRDMVNEAYKSSADKALKKAESGISKVLTEYGVK